ncbi:MAG: hypothetical protein AB1847_19105 [bacterium]
MIRGKKYILLYISIFIFTSLFYLPPCQAQYTGTALNTVVGYGGFFNPLVFTPGFYRTAAVSPLTPVIPAPVLPTVLSAPAATTTLVRTASQTGTWVGTWTSTFLPFIVLFHTGPMSLNIVVDPLLGGVIGTCILQGSRYASAPADVTGVKINDVITVSGLLVTGYDIILTCLLTSPTTMTGFYTVTGTHIPILDEGVFELSLLPPVLI